MVENNDYDMLDSIYYYEDGEVIFSEGSYGDEMYVVYSGGVELSRLVNNEKKVLTVLGKDSFFGEMALLSDTMRTATATAIGRTALLPFDKKAMVKRIETNPKFALHLIDSLTERLIRTTSRLTELTGMIMNDHDDEQIRRLIERSDLLDITNENE
jgi:CRP-like cAMP-binding protein